LHSSTPFAVLKYSFEKRNPFVPFRLLPAPAIAQNLNSPKSFCMRRSKYGYLLLALLVITGLAGTVTPTSITAKDRKFAASSLKETKSEVLKSVSGLSEAQLNFKTSRDRCSIKQCTYRIAAAEKNMWQLLELLMKQPANPEKRLDIKMTDAELINMMEDRRIKLTPTEILEPKKTPYKTMEEALERFKVERTEHIKYIKNTTEDLRNHLTKMPFGWVDCYQLCLVMSAHSNRLMQQIEETKTYSKFPPR
jgi:hypothetical protein